MKKYLLATIMMISGLCLGTPHYRMPMSLPGDSPTIDGVIQPHEWNQSLKLAGFLQFPDGQLSAGNEGFVQTLCDGQHLCVAFRLPAKHEGPGGGLRTEITERDGQVYFDDSVELVIKTQKETSHCYHLIANANGVVYDEAQLPQDVKLDKSWNCEGLQIASVVRTGWWELEMKIPLTSIGSPQQTIYLNACRNMDGQPPAAILPTSAYVTGPTFKLTWSTHEPAIQFEDVGFPAKGQWMPKLRISSAPTGKKYFADMEIREWTYTPAGQQGRTVLMETGTLTAGQSLAGNLTTQSRARHSLEVNVRDGDTGDILFTRTIWGWRGMRTEGIPPTAEFDLEGIAGGTAFYYPGMNKARFTLTPLAQDSIAKAEVAVGNKRQTMKLTQGSQTALIETPATEGEHPVSFTITRPDGTVRHFPNAFTIRKKHLPWENNRLGLDPMVIPPFKPIAMKDGNLQVILRTMKLNGAGLPNSLTCLGHEMMAEEAFYEVTVNGKTERIATGTTKAQIVENGSAANIISRATSPSGIQLETSGRLEYDGFLWNKITLQGLRQRPLERLTMVIPFKDQETPLFHAVGVDTIRFNPAGAIPTGQGKVWGGDQLHRDNFFSDRDKAYELQCVPYIWVGAERRGLAWFINNTLGMKLDEHKAAVRLVRKNGTLRLEADFINVPTTLPEGHRLAFGIQPTPVKPQPQNLRRHHQTTRTECPRNLITRIAGFSDCGECFSGWMNLPWKDDWDLFEKKHHFIQTNQGAKEFKQALEQWHQKYDKDLKEYSRGKQDVDKLSFFEWSKSCHEGRNKLYLAYLNKPGFSIKYTDPTLSWKNDESLQYYRSEWVSRKSTWFMTERTFLTPSSIDYVVYCNFLKFTHGLWGTYYDDMFLMHCRNADTCAAYDSTGRLHGNFGILEMRELVKRTAVILHLMQRDPVIIQIHMTNCLLVPSFAFATSLLTWEDHYGEELFQERVTRDYIRAESAGTQVGAEPITLQGIYRRKCPKEQWPQRFIELSRSHLAMTLPAEIKVWIDLRPEDSAIHLKTYLKLWSILGDFKYWEPECKFVPFYDNDNAIAGVPSTVLIGSYRRTGRVLAVMGNTTKLPQTFTLKTDGRKLGLPADPVFLNAETGQRLPSPTVTIKPCDLLMVEIRANDKSGK